MSSLARLALFPTPLYLARFSAARRAASSDAASLSSPHASTPRDPPKTPPSARNGAAEVEDEPSRSSPPRKRAGGTARSGTRLADADAPENDSCASSSRSSFAADVFAAAAAAWS